MFLFGVAPVAASSAKLVWVYSGYGLPSNLYVVWMNVGLPSASRPTCVKTTNPSARDCSRRTCICGAVPAANCDFPRLSFHVPILGSWPGTVWATTLLWPTGAMRIATTASENQCPLIKVLRLCPE